MKRRLKWILAGAMVIFVIIQFIRPGRADPPHAPDLNLFATNAPPAEIGARLRKSCYNCHSDATDWPWYSRVAPVSWWVSDHVSQGRRRLNFSDWPHDDPRRAARKWRHVAEVVESGEMPLPSYTWMHAEARLSAAQREHLVQWARKEADRLAPVEEQ